MPSTRPLRLVVTTLTALLSGAFGLSAWRDYNLSRQETESELSEVARLMEEHTRAALLVSEVQLSRIQDILGRRLPKQVGGAADHAAMVRLASELPIADSAWVYDADGTVRTTNYQLPPGEFNISDRAYYSALRDGAASFISPLIWGRLRPQPIVAVSRRITDQSGNFAGGVQISLKASYFTDFYHNLSPRNGAIFAIYKDDGGLVIRSTLPPGQETFPKPSSLQANLARGPTGTFTAIATLDKVERLYSYRRMDGYPLVVTTGLPVTQVFAGWRERTLRNGIIAAVMLAAFLALTTKLTATLRREALLRGRAEELLADKEMLFREIHHRVKNNLQIIASFLTMQAVHSRDPATTAAFEEALSRLQSMGLLHQILYEQNEATEVSMGSYLRALADSVGQTFGADQRGIHIQVAPSEAKLPLDLAVPLALLANEALTNALKHAFLPGQGGNVTVELAHQDGGMAFSLADDGNGMAASAKPGLGMTILSALTRQLGGTLTWASESGTRLTLTFPA